MRPDDWHLTEDVDDFLARAGDFLRSRPALHNTPLTDIEKLRTRGADAYAAPKPPVFGRLEAGGEVRAIFYRTPPRRLSLTPLSAEQADTLAAHLAGLGHSPSGVIADHDTATAFAEAWQRHTGAAPDPSGGRRLYRLGTLTPPQPRPEGRGRVAGEQDHEQVVRWCREFCVDVGENVSIDHRRRLLGRHPLRRQALHVLGDPGRHSRLHGGLTSMIAGKVRVDPVYTPAHLRGRGYAGAVTVEVSRAALAAGATDVVLFADPANPTSNALYQRIGYVHVTDFTGYRFSYGAPEAG